MSRDYAKLHHQEVQGRSRQGRRRRLAQMVLMLLLLISVAMTLRFVVQRFSHHGGAEGSHPVEASETLAKTEPTVEIVDPKLEEIKQAADTAAEPEFEFYTMLSEDKASAKQSSAASSASPQSAASGAYILQVASLQHKDEAEKLKARLELLGLDVTVRSFESHKKA